MEGQVLAGKYRLTQLLGQGGMGSVWRAHHLELGTDVAVKLMDPSLASSAEGNARFRREAQAAASIRSPNVVQVFDYGIDEGIPFIAMEMLQGESLAARLERLGRLAPLDTAHILSQVARALTRAHDAGIVHRDLKPDNIFIVRDEDVEIAKVLDFGIAKRTGIDGSMTNAVQTQTGAMMGTPFYMSPEQAAGQKDIGPQSDIWSFGIIACECLTGRRIFAADTLGGLILSIVVGPMPMPSQLGQVPTQFDVWFARCAARDVAVRFKTIREAATMLELVCRESADPKDFQAPPVDFSATATFAGGAGISSWMPGGLPVGTQSGPTSVTIQRPKTSSPKRLVMLGVAAMIVALGVGVFYWSQRPLPQADRAAAAPPAVPTAATPIVPAEVLQPKVVATPAALASTPMVSPPTMPAVASQRNVQANNALATPVVKRPSRAVAPPDRAATTAVAPPPNPETKPVDLAF